MVSPESHFAKYIEENKMLANLPIQGENLACDGISWNVNLDKQDSSLSESHNIWALKFDFFKL